MIEVNFVEMESCSANTPPLERLSYVENVHTFLGGLIQLVFRDVHGYRYTFIGFRRRIKMNDQQSDSSAII